MADVSLNPTDPNYRVTGPDTTNPAASGAFTGPILDTQGNVDPRAWAMSPQLMAFLGVPALRQAFQAQFGEGGDSSLNETDHNKALQSRFSDWQNAVSGFNPSQTSAYDRYTSVLKKYQDAANSADDKQALGTLVSVLGSVLAPGLGAELSGATGLGAGLSKALVSAGVGGLGGGIEGGPGGALLGAAGGGLGSLAGSGLSGLLKGAGGAAGGAGGGGSDVIPITGSGTDLLREGVGSDVLAVDAAGNLIPGAGVTGALGTALSTGLPSSAGVGEPTEVSPLEVTAPQTVTGGINPATILGNIPGLVNTPDVLGNAGNSITQNKPDNTLKTLIDDLIKGIGATGGPATTGIVGRPSSPGGTPGTPDPFTPSPAPSAGPGGGPGGTPGGGTPPPAGGITLPGIGGGTPTGTPAAAPSGSGGLGMGGGAGPGGLGALNLKGSAAPDIYPWSTVV